MSDLRSTPDYATGLYSIVRCPVCGEETMDFFWVCENCYWEYDGTTDPTVWIKDFLLHIHMARGDDLHAIKYLPLKLKGLARHWRNSLPAESIGCWEDLQAAFLDNF